MKQKCLEQYCIGCGLCHSEENVELRTNEKGYLYPVNYENDLEKCEFLKKVCPAQGEGVSSLSSNNVWGNYIGAYATYSTDGDLRKKASSGGTLSALAIYLLEEKKVDGVIHVGVAENTLYETKCYCSTTREEVMERCGSRYAISSPWYNLSQIIEEEKTYCLIGKPCDVTALRNMMKLDKKYDKCIKYVLSFFCAGLPSNAANQRLVDALESGSRGVKLNYRGNGWPGYATLVDEMGEAHQMEYSKSWGGILGRDIHPYCRFCPDGIGELADVACGDGWYTNEAGEPDFSERDGRNVTFSRNEKGQALLEEAQKAGYIELSSWDNIDVLKRIQKYQYTRKTTLYAKMLAFKVMGKEPPQFALKDLRAFRKKGNIKEEVRIFLGTIERAVKGKV